MSFLNSIEKKSKKFESPFIHWELNEPLTEEQVNEIVNADIANPVAFITSNFILFHTNATCNHKRYLFCYRKTNPKTSYSQARTYLIFRI